MLMWANLRLLILATASLASLTQAVQHQTPTNPTTTRSVTISNVHNRYNVSGNIMDAHDGTYNKWSNAPDSPWYYYAMGYGDCHQDQDLCNGQTRCGYGYSWIGVWTSPDLSNNSWTLVREARDDTWPTCVYFRVHTIYNAHTKQYVMWANLNNNGATSGDCLHADYAVGTSNSPAGNFTYVHGIKAGRGSHGGDFDLFVDDDDVAYLIYTDVAGGAHYGGGTIDGGLFAIGGDQIGQCRIEREQRRVWQCVCGSTGNVQEERGVLRVVWELLLFLRPRFGDWRVHLCHITVGSVGVPRQRGVQRKHHVDPWMWLWDGPWHWWRQCWWGQCW